MWPTAEEIAYYKRNAKLENVDDEYVKDQLQLLLGHINEECTETFTPPDFPSSVKMFFIGALSYFSNAQYGIKGERMGSVSFSYDFNELPKQLTDLLLKYSYGRKRNGARFHVF